MTGKPPCSNQSTGFFTPRNPERVSAASERNQAWLREGGVSEQPMKGILGVILGCEQPNAELAVLSCMDTLDYWNDYVYIFIDIYIYIQYTVISNIINIIVIIIFYIQYIVNGYVKKGGGNNNNDDDNDNNNSNNTNTNTNNNNNNNNKHWHWHSRASYAYSNGPWHDDSTCPIAVDNPSCWDVGCWFNQHLTRTRTWWQQRIINTGGMKKTDWISLVFFVFGKDYMTKHQTKKRTQFQHPSESKQRLALVELNMHPRSQTLTEHKSAHRWTFWRFAPILTCLVPFFAWKFMWLCHLGAQKFGTNRTKHGFWSRYYQLPSSNFGEQ